MFLAWLIVCSGPDQAIPDPPREFRAAWVATVANIDWPSRKGLAVADQQAELRRILDVCRDVGLNAVVFQVRPMCDALYESPLEPWSEFLSGTQGVAPSPKYDPLTFAVEEAHRRGLELHAWFNPYRAWQPSAKGTPAASHISKRRPDLVRTYGKHLWLDPGEPEVREHSLEVFVDVVRRYDVDGIHVDDYFYPYPENGPDAKPLPFPDDVSFAKYRAEGGGRSRDDWRRENVNGFIREMYQRTKDAKPWVKVGISPFGIWRPGNPKGIQGFDQYGRLYADAKLWFEQGWLDYMTPQLYWPIKQEAQSYPKLLAWWAQQNRMHRHLWPGGSVSRVGGEGGKGWPASEIADQIEVARKQSGAGGNVHFSMKAILRNQGGVADVLKKTYERPALVPASPWLVGEASVAEPPPAKIEKDRLRFAKPIDDVRLIVVAVKGNEKWTHQIVPAKSDDEHRFAAIPQKAGRIAYAAVDRVGRLSMWREINR